MKEPSAVARAYCASVSTFESEASPKCVLAIIGGYGLVSGAAALVLGTVVTALFQLFDSGTRTDAVLIGVMTAVTAVAGTVGGPMVIKLEDRLQCRHR